ncbi:uncharacterized protein G2W53_040237 [Senna tora]|uniref:Uncharacterized protein n=1 Tax=Senna tora TaxID=362788 RepID=A0A834SRA6_9FABA|nr:uncharacterized protein G2W53_040237 [Senna tora]
MSKELEKYEFKRVVAQVSKKYRFALYLGFVIGWKVSQTNRFALYLEIRVD